MEDRRFIEETFPIKEVGVGSAREKNIRHGNISTLHTWWARKPLGSSRTTIFASLISTPKSLPELQRRKQFIIKLSNFGETLDRHVTDEARKEILKKNDGKPARVIDPFAGGGSIPFEALRLGCETCATEYNPVAVLILKCTVEYPQRYGVGVDRTSHGLVSDKRKNRLLEDVKKWGKWVLDETEREIGRFYPNDKDGSIPVCYMWARTIPCQNPSCNATIPLLPQYWLSKKGNSGIALHPLVEHKVARFKIVGSGRERMPRMFDPDKGNVARAVATCLVCGSVVDNKTTARLFRSGKCSQELVAVVLHKQGVSGKKYRVATDYDMSIFKDSEDYLQRKIKSLSDEWGINPIPDEPTPEAGGSGAERAFLLRNYNMNTWGDLFNSRQLLALVTFIEKVRTAHKKMREEGCDEEYSKAVTSYLALGIDRLADFGSSLCLLNPTGGRGVFHTFSRPVLGMAWTYAESNPFNPFGGGWPTACGKNEKWIEHASLINNSPATVLQASATNIPYPSDYFDAVFTDPPYYDNVPYSYLSDFFYVWLKRTIGDIYPDLFSTPLSPKSKEIVAYSNREGGWESGMRFFEDMLKKSFVEIHRILKPNGISVIVYAHKSFAGWESLVNSLLDSGLVVTGAWPIHTEMKGRLRSQESAALASSIYMIARKYQRERTGFYKEVKQELREHLNSRLDSLWNEGISGADFFIAAIGSSIQIFGKYEKIIDDEGIVIRADKLLEDVRRVATEYAVRQVLHNGFVAEITPLTRFYVLWRWGYGDMKLEFDDALKLGRGVGLDITQEWNKGFIKKDKEFVRILGPEDRELDELKGSHDLIDVLHYVLLLWDKGKNDEAVDILKETGFGKSDVFYRVAQAISESLPNGREKKLLEVFLSGKERITEHVRKESVQTRLIQ
jgi:putative DNA methylase